MKKLVLVLLVLLCMVLFTACEGDAPTTPKSPAESTMPTSYLSPTITAPTETIFSMPQEYQPGSIQLTDQDGDDYAFIRPYRSLYYTIYGVFFELIDDAQRQDLYDWLEQSSIDTNYGENQDEMLLVSFVKRYKISKEDFMMAVNQYISNNQISSTNLLHEDVEIPNADIIYTFDNEIINHYYRYE